MTDVLSEEELVGIEARAEKATPGPWVAWDHNGWHQPYVSVVTPDDETPLGPRDVIVATDDPVGRTWSTRGKVEIELDNATFIAHARTDIPALIAEVRALQAALSVKEKKNG